MSTGPHPIALRRWPEACAAAAGRDLSAYTRLPKGNLQLTFSGGRSSGFQLAMIILANGGLPANAVVTFQNTGEEAEETLRLVHTVERYFGVRIWWLERDSREDTQVRIVDFASADRVGGPFWQLFTETVPRRRDGTSGRRPLPNPVQRTCSAELKTKTAHRFLTRHLGWTTPFATAIGFRAGEDKRVEKRLKVDNRRNPDMGGSPWFPMFDAGHDAGHVLSFWRAMPFDLEIDSDFGNCVTCFMKSVWKLKVIMWQRPAAARRMIELEAMPHDRSNRFRQDRPALAQLLAEAQAGNLAGSDDGKPCMTCMG